MRAPALLCGILLAAFTSEPVTGAERTEVEASGPARGGVLRTRTTAPERAPVTLEASTLERVGIAASGSIREGRIVANRERLQADARTSEALPVWRTGRPSQGEPAYVSLRAYEVYPCARSTMRVDGKTYHRCDRGWYARVLHSGEVRYVAVVPPLGGVTTVLDVRESVRVGEEVYLLSHGDWYRPDVRGDQTRYVLVLPPVGAEVEELPADATPVLMDGRTFFQRDQTFYRPRSRGGYVIVDPPY